MERLYAIGDIHGRLDKLKALMARIDPDPRKDTLVFLGDYIDRGPDSRGVVDFVLNLQSGYRNVACLIGNHERMFLDYIRDGGNRDFYFLNGGRMTLTSYGLSGNEDAREGDFPSAHIHFLKSLLPYYETEDYIFVHAGLRPGVPLKKQDPDDLLWIRGEFIFAPGRFGKTVVFGHTLFHQPFINDGKIGIDTGAVFGGTLTCLELPERKFHQV